MSKFTTAVLILLLTLLFALPIQSQRRFSATDSLVDIKLNNGLNALLLALPNNINTEINFYVRTGSMYESDSVTGIANVLHHLLAQRVTSYLQNSNNPISINNTAFNAYSTAEYSVFRFIPPAQSFTPCFELIRDSVFYAVFSEQEIINTKNEVLREMEIATQSKRKVFENRFLRSIYRQDFAKMNVPGDSAKFQNINEETAKAFFKRYYVPNGTIVTLAGNFNLLSVEQKFTDIFSPLIRSEFDPETITKIFHLRPMVYNTQFIEEDSTVLPEFNICWQFPGTSSNQQASYCAFLISEMLNDKNNFIQVKAAKLGCKKFVAQYEANNFSGILRIILQPDKQKLYATYNFVLNELLRLEKTLLNETMINAGKLHFKNRYAVIMRSKEYPHRVVSYTAFKEDIYFRSLADSVLDLRETELRDFVHDYMNISPYVTGLILSKADRESSRIDSNFAELNDSVENYVFSYRKNISDIEGDENLIKLRNLLQWLTINNEVNIQINGYSDEGEFDKTKDDLVSRFIDSVPTFRIAMTRISGKYQLRPDMMRVVKIAKYLYENGISAERISGTGMKFSSDSDEQEADNMKCTLTLEKLRKRPSLYELHFGKKKE